MPIKYIPWTAHLLGFITFICLLSGCLGLNDVKPLGLGFRGTPPADRAYVIVGLSVEAPQKQRLDHMFSLTAAEYSLERQDITGNCWRYNHMYPGVPPDGGTHQYFAFDVKPGYYTVLGISAAILCHEPCPASSSKALAFEVPAGRIVYLGELILRSDHGLSLIRDANVVRENFPEREVFLAETRQVPKPHEAVCVGP